MGHLDLLKYTTDISTTQFLDQMYSSSLLFQIISPTHISTKPKTVINNIFSTDSPEESISGKIITSLSDHLAQFLHSQWRKPKAVRKKYIKGTSKAIQKMN